MKVHVIDHQDLERAKVSGPKLEVNLELEGVQEVPANARPNCYVLPVWSSTISPLQLIQIAGHFGVGLDRFVVIDLWDRTGTPCCSPVDFSSFRKNLSPEQIETLRRTCETVREAFWIRSYWPAAEIQSAPRSVVWPMSVSDYADSVEPPAEGFRFDFSLRCHNSAAAPVTILRRIREWNQRRTGPQATVPLGRSPAEVATGFILSARESGIRLSKEEILSHVEFLENCEKNIRSEVIRVDDHIYGWTGVTDFHELKPSHDTDDDPGKRAEFAESLRSSRAVICEALGGGLYLPPAAYRAFSAGRPALVFGGPKWRLPFEGEIDYAGWLARFPRKDIMNSAELVHLWRKQNGDKVLELGRKARAVWEKYFDPKRWPALLGSVIEKEMGK